MTASLTAALCAKDWHLKPGTHWRQTIDFVAKVEHIRKLVIFVARMSNVLLTLSAVCTGPKRHESRPCRIRLCLQCLPGLTDDWHSQTVYWKTRSYFGFCIVFQVISHFNEPTEMLVFLAHDREIDFSHSITSYYSVSAIFVSALYCKTWDIHIIAKKQYLGTLSPSDKNRIWYYFLLSSEKKQ